MQVKSFLQNYRRKSLIFTNKFFQKEKENAKLIGKIPEKIINRISDLYPQGKLFRGALTVFAYELATGKVNDDILKASTMVEMFHTSILIADDVFDCDDVRRGLPTIHKQWEAEFPKGKNGDLKHYGETMAFDSTIVGMYLAPQILIATNFPAEIKFKALNYFFKTNVDVGFGESLDVTAPFQNFYEKKNAASAIHHYKTVNYSGVMPLILGSILAGVNDLTYLKNLEKYGTYLGKIFQIQDDIIGSFGDSDKTGKSNCSDLREGRWTILIEILYKLVSEKNKAVLESILDKSERSEEDIKKLKKMLDIYDVVFKAQEKAREYLDKGLKLIPKLTDNKDHQDTLKNLLEFMLARER